MKKLVLSLAMSFAILFANAQFEIGQEALGGSIQFHTSSAKADPAVSSSLLEKNTGFSINPTYSFFKTQTKMVGLGIYYGYNQGKSKSIENNSYKSTGQAIGLNYFMNQYQKIGKDFYFLMNWNNAIQYSFGKNTGSGSYQVESKDNTYALYSVLSPGLAYKINDRFIIEGLFMNLLGLNYGYSVTKYPSKNGKRTSNGLAISSSLNGASLNNVQIGFKYLLKTKK
jgi:hypothetical protein